MAGFEDEISHFNPYVTQLPADEYINAGMMAQRSYEEGVGRAQGAIDNVVNLPILGEAPKQYLQQKIGQLQNKVTSIAGANFGRNNVQSQIGSLTGMIARDPAIQAGVTSALRYQAWNKSNEDLKKDHPDQYSDKNREYGEQYWNDYKKQAQTKVGLVATGPTEATPYVDYYSKLDKSLKEIDPSIQTSISPAGEFMYRIDKSSTISRDQIDGVINSQLLSDPRAQQQMQIDAWSAYRSFNGQQMFEHVNDSSNAMIDSYKQYTKYYQDMKKSNPNDYNTISAANKKITDFNVEIKSLQQNRDIQLKALNEGRVDEVKQTTFNNSIRQGLILKYEKNNITTDLHNNENAIEAYKNKFEEEHLGIERQKLGLEGLEYQLKLREFQAKYGPQGPDQTVSVPGVVGADYTEDAHNGAITNFQGQIADFTTKLRSTLPNMSDGDFKKYRDIQEAKYQAGDPDVDQGYALFKSKTQIPQTMLNTYTGISKKIYGDVGKQYDISNILPEWSTFNGVDLGDGSGAKKIVADKKTVAKALDLREALLSHQHTSSYALPGQVGYSMSSTFPSQDEVNAEEAKFRDDPNFRYIKALAEGALSGKDHLQSTAGGVITYQHQKDNAISDAFKNYGRTVSYNAVPLQGKTEEIAHYNRVVATALQNGQGKAQGGKDVAFENIEAQNVYNDDQGRLNIQYMDKKDSKMYTITVPTNNNVLGNPDPYQPYQRMIDLSPEHSTPTDPKQALSTINGKLKYIISQNPLSNQLELKIWNRGTPYTIPSFDKDGGGYAAPNIGSYVERLEQISRMRDPKQIQQFLGQLAPAERAKWADILGLK